MESPGEPALWAHGEGEIAQLIWERLPPLELVRARGVARVWRDGIDALSEETLALLVKVRREQLDALCAPHRAKVVIYESMNQFVVALPHAELNGLEQTVRRA